MAFCASCGAEVQGRFCAKCGTPVAAAAGSSEAPPPPSSAGAPGAQAYPQAGYSAPQPAGGAVAQPAGLTDNMASALCYLFGWLTGVLFLVLAPYNQNRLIRFHAFQSIFANIGIVVVWIAVMIVSIPLGYIPFVGWVVSAILHFAMGIGMFVGWLYLMYKAYNNERIVLPVVGPLAEKQA